MQKINSLIYKILCFGAYAVICHLAAIVLFCQLNSTTLPAELLTRRAAQMLEYSVMSIVILLACALLLKLIEKQGKNLNS